MLHQTNNCHPRLTPGKGLGKLGPGTRSPVRVGGEGKFTKPESYAGCGLVCSASHLAKETVDRPASMSPSRERQRIQTHDC